ncbi:TIGR03088 family PEP-CTERM/XrtA system glycosyltransferase [Uliginosibacterium sp. H3]|uniref:TIGR03088 family PEP-CTERM/XrtA system glycosyltransferase n=1 Tax=Uliginosibacterium silvisoli TaxID=3114758 RepID=A0ABU6K5P3_9RHOO|nr:TIGR03088 family PEP-CTERM/XrtA system glycosyltransferase [Uliginosibacterium sp. H3]
MRRLRIAHVVYSFKAGGLENVIVQLINKLPAERFEHVVIALTECSEEFARRIEHKDVRFISLQKPPGQIFGMYPRLWRLFRELRPDVLHTCNLAALEVTPVAWLAGIGRRVHVEHGWVVADPDGSNKRYRLMRRLYRPFVTQFVAVSRQLRDYLSGPIGVPPERVALVPNGVDTERFHPADADEPKPDAWPFAGDAWVVGTVGRLDPVKNQKLLIDACAQLVAGDDEAKRRLRLVIVGEGEERAALTRRLMETGMSERAWLPGSRSDVAEMLRVMDCFVLPSIAEGTSCTLQEAMASGLPIVATAVGGNPDVLEHGRCGVLVPSGKVDELAHALSRCLHADPGMAELPAIARRTALAQHALTIMVDAYENLFDPAAKRSPGRTS